MVDINAQADQILVFKGYFQIYVGATPYKFNEIQELEISIRADAEKHYSSGGVKKKVPAGDSSSWRLVIKNTTDLYDTTDPPIDTKTLSYIISQIMGTSVSGGPTPAVRALPLMKFEGVNQSESSVNAFVHHLFNGYIEEVTKQRNREAGTEEIVLSGEIQSHISNQRTAS